MPATQQGSIKRLGRRLRKLLGRRLHKMGLVLLATLALTEVGLRLILGNMALPRFDLSGKDGRCVALEPATSVTYTGWLLRLPEVVHDVNSLGYRGPERPTARPPGAYRILMVGDSFTYGQGVETGQSIPAQLEQVMGQQGQGGVEVLDFGIPGLNLEDSLRQYELFAKRWQHDLVLYDFFDNDFEPSICDHLADRSLLWMLRNIYLARVGALLFWDHLVPTDHDAGRSEIRLAAVIRAFVDSRAETGARFGLVLLGGAHTDRTRASVRALSMGLGFPVFDIDRECSRHIPEIPNEYHYTPEGNRLVADCLAHWLEGQVMAPFDGTGAPAATPARPAPVPGG